MKAAGRGQSRLFSITRGLRFRLPSGSRVLPDRPFDRFRPGTGTGRAPLAHRRSGPASGWPGHVQPGQWAEPSQDWRLAFRSGGQALEVLHRAGRPGKVPGTAHVGIRQAGRDRPRPAGTRPPDAGVPGDSGRVCPWGERSSARPPRTGHGRPQYAVRRSWMPGLGANR